MTTLRRDDLRQLMGLESHAYIPGSTSSAGLSDGSTLVDNTRFRDSNMSPLAYKDALILITSGSAAGNIRRVQAYDPTGGKFTLTPPASAQVAASVTFELWTLPVFNTGTCDGLEKELIHLAIDDAIARTSLDYNWRHYLTLCTDGDMETSGVTNWTASNATLTKSTTTVGEGVQSLRVANSAANGYAQSASIAVLEDEGYQVEATVFISSGVANLVIRDVTNSTTISTEALADADQLNFTQTNAWCRLWSSVDIPTGCRQIQLRLTGTGATDDIYWENVIVRRLNGERSTLPSWVTNRNKIARVVSRRLGIRYGQEDWQPFPYTSEAFIQNPAAVPTELQHDRTSRILAVEGNRSNTALTTVGTAFATNDAVTIIGDQDYILAVSMTNLYDRLASRAGRDNTGYLEKRAEWASKVSRLSGARLDRRRTVRSGGNVSYFSGRWR